jgi:DNA-binding transcriptional regulator YiaG
MGKVEAIIKSEIVRLAKREMKQTFIPLSREVRSLKITISQLRKAVQGLQRWAAQQEKLAGGQRPPLEASPEEMKKARFSPRLIKSLRKRLGVSQKEMALLAGVTVGAIFQWEKGIFEPRGEKKKILVALRKLRRREARKLLEEKSLKMAPKKHPRPKGRSRRKTPKK